MTGSSAQSSMVRERWWAVIVAATVGPQERTAEMAEAVVMCSRIMRRDYLRGKVWFG